MAALPKIQFTHCGIFCSDLEMMVDYYRKHLGFVVSDKGVASTGHRLYFMTQDPEIHHQLVLFDGKPTDLPFNPVNQLSLLMDSLADLQSYYQRAVRAGIQGIEQVDHGNAWSIYFKDPEGNPLELYVDSPFFTAQPCREPLDLDLPEEEVLRLTEAMCRRRPGFLSREAWIQEMRERIAAQRLAFDA
jgi:catechol-2,3-dioxygenase